MRGSTEDEITYFTRLRPGESIGNPSWLLRRVGSGAELTDELLERDGEWRPTRMLTAVERGDLPGTLRRVPAPLARGIVNYVSMDYRAARRALDPQQAGEFTLRLATAAVTSENPPLDAEGRAEFAVFLTGAPLVGEGLEGVYRTDGLWVWPESLAATVLATGAKPQGIFAYHIRLRCYLFPDSVPPQVIERARRLLELAATADGSEPVREANVPGRPPPLTREQRMAALGSWHSEWVRRHAATTPFRPELHAGEDDYNLHHVDLDASPEAEHEYTVRAREILGKDPETGETIDI